MLLSQLSPFVPPGCGAAGDRSSRSIVRRLALLNGARTPARVVRTSGRLPVHRRTCVNGAMAQSQPTPGPEHAAADRPPPVPMSPSDLDQARRTSMAAERTWLAWWRTALAGSVGALGVGRLAPELLGVAAWPYVVLGCGYALLAIGLLLVGAQRQRELEHALRTGGHVPLRFRTVGLFTVGGVALALLTVVLVIAQT